MLILLVVELSVKTTRHSYVPASDSSASITSSNMKVLSVTWSTTEPLWRICSAKTSSDLLRGRGREGGRKREGGMGGRIATTSMVVVCAHPEYVHVLLKSPPWKIVLSLSEGVMLI